MTEVLANRVIAVVKWAQFQVEKGMSWLKGQSVP